MTIHKQFLSFVSKKHDGAALVAAYRAYKDSSFQLNGCLKAGLPLSPALLEMYRSLRQLICGKTTSEFVVYRMTSRLEFIGPLLSVIDQSPIQYSAFMSTSTCPEQLHSFTPSNDPLVLKITCPVGTPMALMEANEGAGESEVLLGVGTRFRLGNPEIISSASEASQFTGQKRFDGVLTVLPMYVADCPYEINDEEAFSFCGESAFDA